MGRVIKLTIIYDVVRACFDLSLGSVTGLTSLFL
jgi:hypothetical protein